MAIFSREKKNITWEDPAGEDPAGEDPAGEAPATAFTAYFSGDEGVAGINVYYTKDYAAPSVSGAGSAVARDGDGAVDVSGDGQVNFGIVLADGYSVFQSKLSQSSTEAKLLDM